MGQFNYRVEFEGFTGRKNRPVLSDINAAFARGKGGVLRALVLFFYIISFRFVLCLNRAMPAKERSDAMQRYSHSAILLLSPVLLE